MRERFKTSDGYVLYRVATSCGSEFVWRDSPHANFDLEFSDHDGLPADFMGVDLDGALITTEVNKDI
jgi:hypothetical protein